MLGLYEDFPENIHRIDNFTSTLSNQKFQQKLVQTLHDVNRKPFGLEEISHPSLHECTVIFEVGIAEIKSFNFIDDEESTERDKKTGFSGLGFLHRRTLLQEHCSKEDAFKV
jgi:hypothetical protein